MGFRTRLTAPTFLLFVALTSLGRSLPARGEPSPSERAIAQRLFDQAKEQLGAHRVRAACESFAESQRLDPATGTLLNLAACHEQEGKLASAWVEFRECLSTIRGEARPDRLRFALDHLAVIEPRLAYLTLMVPDVRRGPAPTIRLDGRDLGRAAWGVPIPVDAGEHETVAQTEEGRLWRVTIRVRNGERRTVSVPLPIDRETTSDERADTPGDLVRGAAPRERAARTGEVARAATDQDRVRLRAPVRLSRARTTAAIAMGSLGLVAIGVATYAGFHAETLWRERNQACHNDVCSPEGLRLGDRAETSAQIATWSFAGGVAAFGAGAVLWLWTTDPASPAVDVLAVRRVSATPLPGGWRFQLGGVF
jgi:hypothetical protein